MMKRWWLVALVALGIGGFAWGLYRDYCRDAGASVAVGGAAGAALRVREQALGDSLATAQAQTVAMRDSLQRALVVVGRLRGTLAGHTVEDAHHAVADSVARDSLRVVVAGAVASAHDSLATVDSLRRVVAVVVAVGQERGRLDSLALGRSAGRLREALAVIGADSVALGRATDALGAMTRRATLAEQLVTVTRSQRDAAMGEATQARREAQAWKLGTIGAGVVAILAAVR